MSKQVAPKEVMTFLNQWVHTLLSHAHTFSFLLTAYLPVFLALTTCASGSMPLCRLFSVFDALAGSHGVQKVETAGDCYIVAAGILTMDGEGFSEV